MEWMQSVKVQLSNAELLDTHRPTFHWEGDDLVLERKDAAVASQMPFKIQTTFAQKMGWLVKTNQGHWAIGPNLNYSLCNKWMMRQTNGQDIEVTGMRPVLTSLGSDSSLRSKMTVQNDQWMELNLLADWKFLNLRQAFVRGRGT